MECPVCKSPGLTEDNLVCPSCGSDLEALHMTGVIKKDHRNMKSFGIVVSALLLIALLGWVFSAFNRPLDKDDGLITEFEQVKEALILEQEKNDVLISENDELRSQLSAVQHEKERRKKEYIVREGESLFLIARKIYGNGYRYADIAKANNIDNADQLNAGQKLIIHY
jgi:nucleoid-associated protein YgaU